MTNELSEQDRIALENHMDAQKERQAAPLVPSGPKGLSEQDRALVLAAQAKPKAPVRMTAAALAARNNSRTAAAKEERRHENQIGE
ncbi:hypothetical protein [Arthrobacter sp. SO3]|uniref:hypothetical protein n=1 Tax=Arthrobacter sp. SO3 TaxID=1897057 RepID=UPI001D000A26|nr:hypothetical protein [Arthrobacter sp. SO3]